MKVELNRKERSVKWLFTDIEWNRFINDATGSQVPVMSDIIGGIGPGAQPEIKEEKRVPVAEPYFAPKKDKKYHYPKEKGSRVEHMFPGFKKPQNTYSNNEESIHKYKGFLHGVCEKCGKERSFFTKTPIDKYTCAECGHVNDFGESSVKRVFTECKCGRELKYWTNATGEKVKIACVECGTESEYVSNYKKTVYKSIK